MTAKNNPISSSFWSTTCATTSSARGGHPYMKTPHIDRLAHEGALFERAFHTTPICSPNRASIVTGQYASRHGIIDNVGARCDEPSAAELSPRAAAPGLRDRAHRQVAHGQRRHAAPRLRLLGQLDGMARITDPVFWEGGRDVQHSGYITDLLNERAVEFVARRTQQAVFAFLRAQGRASGRAESRTATHRPRDHGRLRAAPSVIRSSTRAACSRSRTCGRSPRC